MNCEQAEALVQEELDGTLGAEPAGALHRHLEQCGACRRERHWLMALVGQMARLPEPDLPNARWEALAEQAIPAPAARRRAWPALALAAALVLVVAAALQWRSRQPAGREPVPEQPAMAALPRPVPEPAANEVAPRNREPAPASPRPAHRLPARREAVRHPRRQPFRPAPPTPEAVATAGLSGEDVMLIYEQALRLAAYQGPEAPPGPLVTTARVSAASGDVAGAVRDYERAVQASIGAPSAAPVRSSATDGVTEAVTRLVCLGPDLRGPEGRFLAEVSSP